MSTGQHEMSTLEHWVDGGSPAVAVDGGVNQREGRKGQMSGRRSSSTCQRSSTEVEEACEAKAWPAVGRRWPAAVELAEVDVGAGISVARLWLAVTQTGTRCRRCTASSRHSFRPGGMARRRLGGGWRQQAESVGGSGRESRGGF
jgi:hypothetical protein